MLDLTESPPSLDTSSLERLIRLPVQRIKLDRFMIEGIVEQAERQQMVRAILTLARTLGLCVIAEGVETPAELEVLQRLGVDALQGFWLGRPQAADCWKDAGHAVMDRNHSPF